ncbi:hypothetical protein EXU57_18850 [Segetibacter sp. 3557_3]|uniref:hypothetical protein n=1 Tax=Segetibacter sp. 3557_3 TaxID=2547429 RepID=UPI001058427F|nr:hypothetical protein [Segetibacter sp. 3557_3]TDH21569.1 hypothetical protein EXU57_18850 [Segetibacter sp. 3557_3]
MDSDLRGRTELEIGSLLKEGIQKVDPRKKVDYVANEFDAVDRVLASATTNSFAVFLVDNVSGICDYLDQRVQQYELEKNQIKKAMHSNLFTRLLQNSQ